MKRHDRSNAFEQDEAALFSAMLTPHRSLEPHRLSDADGVRLAVSFAAGIVFLMMGAWPVFGFFGLDVLAISGRSGSISAAPRPMRRSR